MKTRKYRILAALLSITMAWSSVSLTKASELSPKEPEMITEIDQSESSPEETAEIHSSPEDAAYIAEIQNFMTDQWNQKAIHATNAVAGDDEVRIAILDSGVDKGCGIAVEQVSLDEETEEMQIRDMTGHGTAIASLIKGTISGEESNGIIPHTDTIKLYSIEVLDASNEASVDKITEGLQWCIDHQIDIINMSFSMDTDSEALHDIIKKVADAGILMVAAAGSNGEEAVNTVQYPAAYSEVIAVGAVDSELAYCAFSPKGAEIELVAPGERVPVATYFGTYGAGNGTSLAAAQVSAVAALLLSQERALTAEQVRNLMQSASGTTQEGYKLVNYERAKEFLTRAVNISEFDDVSELDGPLETASYQISEKVQAAWGYKNHGAFVTDMTILSQHQLEIIAYASRYADACKDTKDTSCRALHGGGGSNYVAAAKCFLEAAQTWDGKNTDAMLAIFDNYKEITKSKKDETIQQMKNAAKLAITKNFKHELEPDADTEDYCSKTRGKLQLLGFAIHLSGDVYAHKTKVPTDAATIDNIKDLAKGLKNNGLVKDGNGNILLCANLASGKAISTVAMVDKTYVVESYKGKYNDIWTDNVNFLPERYSMATKVATRKLMGYYNNSNSFRPYVFCPMELNATATYPYQTADLVENMTLAGYEPSKYLNGYYRTYTVADWNHISFVLTK